MSQTFSYSEASSPHLGQEKVVFERDGLLVEVKVSLLEQLGLNRGCL
jgi:hypothetical protein